MTLPHRRDSLRKAGEPTSVGPCKVFFTKVRIRVSLERRAKSVVPFGESHQPRQNPASCSHRHKDHKGSNAHTRKTYCVDCGTHIDSVPREIYNALEATR